MTAQVGQTKKMIQYGDKLIDITDLAEQARLQAELIPENFPISPREGVVLAIMTADMVAFQLKRHLLTNFRLIAKQAQELKDEGEAARVRVNFTFELDQSAPTVAAMTACKMSFGIKHSSESKPVANDINQGDFYEDMAVALDTHGIDNEREADAKAKEEAALADKTAKDKAAADAKAKAASDKKGAATGGSVTPLPGAAAAPVSQPAGGPKQTPAPAAPKAGKPAKPKAAKKK